MCRDTSSTSLVIMFYFLSAILAAICFSRAVGLNSTSELDDTFVYVWPLPAEFAYGDKTLSVDPDLLLTVDGYGGKSVIIREAFERYRAIIFKHTSGISRLKLRGRSNYDVSGLRIIVHSDSESVS